ncbi:MAG: tetratricopeptide repeat protein [Candidatus Obscuribacterales bacterium]|nr:tetratricopeptide repeat protein [Candidatus Obscuribacterales bacterium]
MGRLRLSLLLSLLFLVLSWPGTISALAKEYGDDVAKLLDQAQELLEQGQIQSARRLYEQALSLEPNCPDAFNGIGLSHKLSGDYKKAAASYQAALRLKPDHYESLYNLANTHYLSQNYAEAASYYTRAITVKGAPDAELLASLATVYRDKAKTESGEMRKADWQRSLSYFQQAAKCDPGSHRIPAYLGQLYVDMGNLSQAEREFKQAIALKKDYAFAYFHLGRLEALRGRLPAALISWWYSLKYETVPAYREDTLARIREFGMPASVMEHFAQAYEYLAASRYDLAEVEFEAAASTPGRMQACALNNLGYVYVRQKRYKEALSAYKKALTAAPNGFPELYFNMAQVYRSLEDKASAQKALEQALAESRGNYYLAHNLLAILLKEKTQYDLSLKHYNFAQMQSGDALPVVHLNKGILLEKMAKKNEAKRSYLTYLKAESAGVNADFARRRLLQLK